MEELKGTKLTVAITIACCAGFVLFGYDQAIAGGILSGLPFKTQFDNPSQVMQGVITSTYHVGCAIGGLVSFVIGNLGRKNCIIMGTTIMIVGSIIQASSFGRLQLIIGRVITGVGNGMNTCFIPIWQAETLPPETRGSILNIQSSVIVCGIALSNWVCFGFSHINSSIQWRFPLAFQSAFALITVIMVPFLPESPRWLISRGRIDEGTKILAKLRGKAVDDLEIITERDEIYESSKSEKEVGESSWKEVFSQGERKDFQRMLLGIGPLVMSQWCGINTLSAYFPVVLETLIGLKHQVSLMLAAAAATQYAVFSIFPIFYIDRLGRRLAMMFGLVACGVCMAVISGSIRADNKIGGVFAIVFMFLFDDVFALGIHAVAWMYACEINTLRTRNKGVAITIMLNWLSNFVIVMITPVGIKNLNYKFYIIWAVLCVSFIPIVYYLYPETARKSLEAIDIEFMEKPGILRGRFQFSQIDTERKAKDEWNIVSVKETAETD